MAEQHVITLMLDDLFQQQPISTAICLGHQFDQTMHQSIQWDYFNVTEFLNLPFQQRYDVGLVFLNSPEINIKNESDITRILVKLRDLMAKRLIVVSRLEDEGLLRALGLTQLIDKTTHEHNFALWQFNILTYKHVPDWFNSKFWANPENWNKFRW